jgi:hypothetical protein
VTSNFTSPDPEIQQLLDEISERIGRLNEKVGLDNPTHFALVAAPNPYRRQTNTAPRPNPR